MPEGRTAYIQADLREPDKILADPVVRETLDFDRPVALMLIAVLPFLADSDDPAGIVATLLAALPPGSYLAASHGTADFNPATLGIARAYQAGGVTLQSRTGEEFGRLFFSSLELVPPGVVLLSEWRPEDTGPMPRPEEVNMYGGVGRKP